MVDVRRPRTRRRDPTGPGGLMRALRLGCLCAMWVALPSMAAAQSTVTDIIDFLVTNQAVPTANPDRDRAAADEARDTITRALLVNLASSRSEERRVGKGCSPGGRR